VPNLDINSSKIAQKPFRVLVIRLSSMGDIIQCSVVPQALRQALLQKYPDAKIDWLVRSDFFELARSIFGVDQIISVDRKNGWRGLVATTQTIEKNEYQLIYDAHNNLRSHLLIFILRARFLFGFFRFIGLQRRPTWPALLRRSKFRLRRFLLFRFRVNLFPKPFRGAESFLSPLLSLGVSADYPQEAAATLTLPPQNLPDISQTKRFPVIGLAPSAAWQNKTWPEEHFAKMISILTAKLPGAQLRIYGGPQDELCARLANQTSSEDTKSAPGKIVNLAGKLTVQQSLQDLSGCDIFIGNDTGLTHAADQMGLKTLVIMGPTAFGYPSRQSSMAIEIPLKCRPCSKDGRDPCSNKILKKCLVDISAESVADRVLDLVAKLTIAKNRVFASTPGHLQ
jgi:ADP-heptose:LPS heptosyltransferase